MEAARFVEVRRTRRSPEMYETGVSAIGSRGAVAKAYSDDARRRRGRGCSSAWRGRGWHDALEAHVRHEVAVKGASRYAFRVLVGTRSASCDSR